MNHDTAAFRVAMQSIVRNPLASPELLGVTQVGRLVASLQ
nr:iron chelate uptake ABC transporter family permease subunit [Burkholderia sp. AU28863]